MPTLPVLVNLIFEAIIANRIPTEDGQFRLSFGGLPIDIDSIRLDDLICSGRLVTPEWTGGGPAPGVTLEGAIETYGTQVTDYEELYINSNVSVSIMTSASEHRARYIATPRYMVHPIAYQWFLDDQPLRGTASVSIGDANVDYAVDRDRYELTLGLGDSIDSIIEVRAFPHDGTEQRATAPVRIVGTTQSGSAHGEEVMIGPSVFWPLGFGVWPGYGFPSTWFGGTEDLGSPPGSTTPEQPPPGTPPQ